MLGKLLLLLTGVVMGLALSQSDIGAQLAQMVSQGVHLLVG